MKYTNLLCKVILLLDNLYEFICQIDILNHYIFWKHTIFVSGMKISQLNYIPGHRLHELRLLKLIYYLYINLSNLSIWILIVTFIYLK